GWGVVGGVEVEEPVGSRQGGPPARFVFGRAGPRLADVVGRVAGRAQEAWLVDDVHPGIDLPDARDVLGLEVARDEERQPRSVRHRGSARGPTGTGSPSPPAER